MQIKTAQRSHLTSEAHKKIEAFAIDRVDSPEVVGKND